MLKPLLLLVLSSTLSASDAFQHHVQMTSTRSRRRSHVTNWITSNSAARTHRHHQVTFTLASSLLDPSASAAAALPSFINVPSLVSITVTYLSLILLYDRPRGTLPARDALSIAPSRVPNAGLGLYVTRSLPEGTVLGTYPGVLRSQSDFIDGKCRMYPKAVYYSWRLNDSGYVLDPTDSRGEIQSYCYGGSDVVSEAAFLSLLRLCAKPTDLARINEPPVGFGGCNVVAREEKENKCVRFALLSQLEEQMLQLPGLLCNCDWLIIGPTVVNIASNHNVLAMKLNISQKINNVVHHFVIQSNH